MAREVAANAAAEQAAAEAAEKAAAEQAAAEAAEKAAAEQAAAEAAEKAAAEQAAAVQAAHKTVIESVAKVSEESVQTAKALQQAALRSFKNNMAINTVARALFYAGAILFLATVAYFLAVRFDAFVDVLIGSPSEPVPELSRTLFAILTPIVIGLIGATLFVVLAAFIQARGNAEATRTMAEIGRLMRESPTATSVRSRGLTQILEETLANARTAFSIQLWITRVLFGAGVALLFVFVGSLFFNDQLVTGGAAATSLLALVAAALLNPQRQIRSDLANTTLLATILANYTRQTTLLEEHLYVVIQQFASQGRAEQSDRYVQSGVRQLREIMSAAVTAVTNHVGAPEQVSPREVWLWRQIALGSDPSGNGSSPAGVEPSNGDPGQSGSKVAP